jgi:hypothetical protein
MKKFFKVLMAILFIIIFLMIVLDYSYSLAFKYGQPRSKIQNILQLKNKHYDLAFFGSSRTENHIDCKLITELTGKSCVNFGISGGSPGDMLILMKLAKNRQLTFDKVFMQVDYNYNSFGISHYFKANLIPFIGEQVVKEQLDIYDEEFLYSWLPFYRFMVFDKVVGLREATASFLKLKHNTNIEVGFFPKQGIGKAVSGSFPETIKPISYELNEMEEFYKNSETKLEFFTAPYCAQIKNRNFMQKVRLKIPRLHNYIDLLDDKDEYFFNCGHLNENGAKVFTKILVKDLLL